MKRTFILAAAVATMAATPSMAAITLTAAPGATVYTGPTPTYDFESAAPLTGGTVTTGQVANPTRTTPLGSTGNYAVFGPAYGTGLLSLTSFPNIGSVSFIWGSLDAGNLVDFLDAAGNILASFNGSNVYSQSYLFSAPGAASNPLVTFNLTGSSGAALDAIRFSSSTNSFEIDNVAVQIAPVPEPATWAMMVLGFLGIGFGMRRRKAAAKMTNLQFA